MANKESGYAKNAANLKDLVIRLKTLGDDYNPPKPKLSVEALEILSKNADDATRALSLVLPVYSKAVDEQELILRKICNKKIGVHNGAAAPTETYMFVFK
ncbi:hypothetical protein [Pedobacter kyonggii]|uniref:Uncharacterized protein n=1 Tax=Pedobacter kyonggii TaxID=1926871 RepID=A0A4Q9HAY7_9SPHI|nr:hypothetical protein [Pedobacter kyonggii]TBO41312.1 hypothetical protein EYS08_15055 [Pedobacter kyonggii]